MMRSKAQYNLNSSIDSARHAGRAAAFTMIELIVSIGILGILLVMAGSIFTLTLKSSGQATALIEVSQLARTFEQTLREDLRYVRPGASIMAIQGNRVKAYWTLDDKEADADGDPINGPRPRDPFREVVNVDGDILPDMPRADLLMFFTARPGKSFTDPSVSGQIQQVVYGHAELGEIDIVTNPKGRWIPSYSDPADLTKSMFGDSIASRNKLKYVPPGATGAPGHYDVIDVGAPANWLPVLLPARQWHLARRSVLIADALLAPPNYYPAADLNDADESGTDSFYEGVYGSALDEAFYIRDGRRDFLVNDPNSSSGFYYQDQVIARFPDPAYDNNANNIDAVVNWMPRSRIDLDPPAVEAHRLGHYFLPNCASFKVEWAVELDVPGACRELIWIDPADLAGTVHRIYQRLKQIDADALAGLFDDRACADVLEGRGSTPLSVIPALQKLLPLQPDLHEAEPAAYPTRFMDFGLDSGSVGGDNGTPRAVHIFYPTSPPNTTGQTPSYVPDPLFPKALRITIDLYDSAGRLDKPLRHVMILPVGQG